MRRGDSEYDEYEEHKIQTFDDYLAMLRRSYHLMRKLNHSDPNEEAVRRRVATAVSFIVEEIYVWNLQASGWDTVGDAVKALVPPPYGNPECMWALEEVNPERGQASSPRA
ncbi:hypothetical protein HNQ40_003348 [Algisphaera agarilytica]|uniref:Uncharacterized protein n=1 Tax=Algisphaera agarilytica TaxID=1385975 RepID=A0A7X0H9F4_9BACT|nr:hypothetical protein [Algisphaera agarilytica]